MISEKYAHESLNAADRESHDGTRTSAGAKRRNNHTLRMYLRAPSASPAFLRIRFRATDRRALEFQNAGIPSRFRSFICLLRQKATTFQLQFHAYFP